MKKKYSLMIADMQLNVVADAEPEQVEMIVGILDRKMRDINLKSRCCSKNEAALLCALEFCADRLTLQEQINNLETRNEKYATVLAAFKEQVAELEEEQEKLRQENTVLRSLISNNTSAEEPVHPVSPSEFLAAVAEAQTEPADRTPSEPVMRVEEVVEVKAAPQATEDPVPETSPRKSRSRVGSMFDLLSFNEV